MRVPSKWFPVALLAITSPVLAQEALDDDAMATLPLDDEFPDVRPQIPRAATQPTTQPSPQEQKDYLLDDPWGTRTWLIEHGITPGARLSMNFGRNVAGGRSTRGSAFNTLLNLSLEIDTEKLAGFPGGTAYFSFQQQHGVSASDEAGNLQEVDGTVADGRTQLSEAWYQQAFLDKKWLVKAGKIDAGADFAFSDFAADFFNAAMPVAYSNFFLPTYPDSAFGVDTFIYPSDNFYLAFGAFDGALARGVTTGENGPHTLFGSPSNTYLIAEGGMTWQVTDSRLSGRVKVGAWYETGDIPSFDGGSKSGAWGPYVILDQKLWRANPSDDNDDRGIGLFFIYNHADGDLFPITDHIAGGLAWKGMIPSRDADIFGLGVSYSRLSGNPNAGFSSDAETAIETFYKIQVTPYLTIKPDLQYILDPADADSSNALVASVRVEITF